MASKTYTIRTLIETDNCYNMLFEESGMLIGKSLGVIPKVGDKLTIIRTDNENSTIRGAYLNDTKLYYHTDEDLERFSQNWLEQIEKDKISPL